MFQKSFSLFISFLLLFCLSQVHCKREKVQKESGTIHIRLAAEPEQVDPLLVKTLADRQLNNLLFLPMLDYDPQTLELVPALATSLPVAREITDGPWKGGMEYDFTIRPEAVWDNGTPVTAADYIFSFKTLLNPGVNAARFRIYFNFLKNIIPDTLDQKKFTVVTDRPYVMALEALGTIGIYPAYHYDQNEWTKDISVANLANTKTVDSIYQNTPALQKFAENFNNKNPRQVIGGNAYQIKDWVSNQRIILNKKEAHWTDKIPSLEAHPGQLIFNIIPDINSAISLLQSEKIDVLTGIPPLQFARLKKDPTSNYQFHTSPKLSYDYIGINGNNKKLANKSVRRALAHLVDVEEIITKIWEGQARRTTGPIYPGKEYYHSALTPIKFDPNRANILLNKSGFGTDQSKLKLRYFYNIKNEKAEAVGLLLQKAARAINVEITPTGLEIKALLKTYRQRDYDLIYLTWTTPSGLDDLRQTWHSSGNAAGGSNRTGFGNKTSDQIIDEIRITYDQKARKELYLRIQEIIYEEQPYIFLYTPLERMAVHQRFTVSPTALYPGYTLRLFNNSGKNSN